MDDPLPRALELLWLQPGTGRRARGLSRDRIVAEAVKLADADGLDALSMGRLAQRLGCGTMSLYRHVENKDELVTFMMSTAPGPPPALDSRDWRAALDDWAGGLWDVYHRHPWVLRAAGPPADPGQLAWLEAGLAAMGETGLAERDKLSAVMAVLHFVRGAAALDIEATGADGYAFSALLRRLIDPARFPAVTAALEGGVFDAGDDRRADFSSGMALLLDGIARRIDGR